MPEYQKGNKITDDEKISIAQWVYAFITLKIRRRHSDSSLLKRISDL
jgi:hypothetical protein